MINQEIIPLEINHKILQLKCSENDFDISSHLLGYIYHSNLQLKLEVNDQSNISIIGQCLENLNHLNSLDITISSQIFKQELSIKEILIPLKSFVNLKEFKLKLLLRTHYLNYHNILNEFVSNLQSLTQLESLSLDLSQCSFILEKEIYKRRNTIDEALYFSQHKTNFEINDSQLQQDFKKILASINRLTNLKILSYELKFLYDKQVGANEWSFGSLHQLQELSIKLKLDMKLNLIELCDKLKQLQGLLKLQVHISQSIIRDEVENVFNTAFNLKYLEIFHFYLRGYQPKEPILIGKEVCEDSNIKTLRIDINCMIQREFIAFGRQIKNLKSIEKFHLLVDYLIFSQESVSALLEWKSGWKVLKELLFQCHTMQNPSNLYQPMNKLLGECFSHSRTLIKLTLNFAFNQNLSSSVLLTGLSELSNLQSLKCSRLIFGEITDNLETEYINCFQNLSQLTELVFMSIKTDEELLYIWKSLVSLQKLQSLDMQIYSICSFKNLNVFCENLVLLKHLTTFHFLQNILFAKQEELINLQELQLIFNSISKIRSIRDLQILPSIQEIDEVLFKEELNKFILSIQQVTCFSILTNPFKQNRRLIIKRLKNLVILN